MILAYDWIVNKKEQVKTTLLIARYMKAKFIKQMRHLQWAGEVLGKMDDGTFYIAGMAFYPEFRNQGLGTNLLSYTEEAAIRAGAKKLELDAETYNEGAIRLYQRFGMKTVGEPRVTVIDGQEFEFIRLSKSISPASQEGDFKMSEEQTGKLQWKPTWKDFVLTSAGGFSFIALIAWSVLFYNWAGLDWLSYLGWATFTVGVILMMLPRVAFQRKDGAPKGGSWLQTTVVVDSGIYAVVRHPMYLGFILVLLALILISQHWLSAIFSVPWILFLGNAIRGEEKVNIERFGDDYKRYVQSVPRVNILVGAMRLLRRSKRG